MLACKNAGGCATADKGNAVMAINWNDLQDFLLIARTGQLARAAAQSGVDATTMGRRLRRLEVARAEAALASASARVRPAISTAMARTET